MLVLPKWWWWWWFLVVIASGPWCFTKFQGRNCIMSINIFNRLLYIGVESFRLFYPNYIVKTSSKRVSSSEVIRETIDTGYVRFSFMNLILSWLPKTSTIFASITVGTLVLYECNSESGFYHNVPLICSKLYWVDSKYKTLESVNVGDGNGRSSVSLASVTGNGHVFGLTISSGNAYVSCWNNNASIIRVQLSNNALTVYSSSLSTGAVFSNAYVGTQPSGFTIDSVSLFSLI